MVVARLPDLAQEVVLDDGVGHRESSRVFWSTLFRSSGRLLLMAFQFLYCRGHISVSAIVILPSPCVDVFPPTKQPSKECVSLFWHVPPCPSRAPAQRLWLEADSLAPVAEWECCEPTGAAAGEHSRRGDKYFPALEVRTEERLAVLGHAQSEWSKMALLAVGAV